MNDTISPDAETGLRAGQVAQKRAQGRQNVLPDRATKSTAQILKDNVCTLFNLFNLRIAAALALVEHAVPGGRGPEHPDRHRPGGPRQAPGGEALAPVPADGEGHPRRRARGDPRPGPGRGGRDRVGGGPPGLRRRRTPHRGGGGKRIPADRGVRPRAPVRGRAPASPRRPRPCAACARSS